MESANIKQSLLAFNRTIRSLTAQIEPKRIPYRDSKLTRYLFENLKDKSAIIIIATIDEAISTFYQTINTLEFASSCAELKSTKSENEPIALNLDATNSDNSNNSKNSVSACEPLERMPLYNPVSNSTEISLLQIPTPSIQHRIVQEKANNEIYETPRKYKKEITDRLDCFWKKKRMQYPDKVELKRLVSETGLDKPQVMRHFYNLRARKSFV